MRILLVLAVVFVLLSCSPSKNSNVYFPITTGNQAQISDYLKQSGLSQVNFRIIEFRANKDSNLSNNSIDQLVGLLEVNADSKRDMETIYNGLSINTSPRVSVSSSSAIKDWTDFGYVLQGVVDGNRREFDISKPIYMKVDIANKKYEIYQY